MKIRKAKPTPILPTTYDDSLSYYELLDKLITICKELDIEFESFSGSIDGLRRLINQLQIEIDEINLNKMEYYVVKVERRNGQLVIVKDGVVQTFQMLKNVFEDEKYFLYLVYNYHVYIPSIEIDTGMVFDNTSIYRESDGSFYPEHDRVLIKDNNEVSTVHLTAEIVDNKATELSGDILDELTDDEKAQFYPSIGAVEMLFDEKGGAVKDVQINGTSILEDGVADIPKANDYFRWGISRYQYNTGLTPSENYVYLNKATNVGIDNRVTVALNGYGGITPNNLDYAVKAAMTDGKGAEWTDTEKASARERMGIDKPWVLKGTLTKDNYNIMVDLTGCTEFQVRAQANVTANVHMATNYGNLLYGLLRPSTINRFAWYKDTEFGMSPVYNGYNNSTSYAPIAGDDISNAFAFVNGEKISGITRFYFINEQDIVSCSVEIYAR